LDAFKPSLVVIDSVSSIEHSTSSLGFRQFLIGMAALLRRHGRSALLTQAVGGLGDVERTAPYLLTVSDVILSLDHIFRDDGSAERVMRVVKMRGSGHDDRAHRFSIGQGGIALEGPEATSGAS